MAVDGSRLLRQSCRPGMLTLRVIAMTGMLAIPQGILAQTRVTPGAQGTRERSLAKRLDQRIDQRIAQRLSTRIDNRIDQRLLPGLTPSTAAPTVSVRTNDRDGLTSPRQ